MIARGVHLMLYVKRINRRLFLRGAGGTLLALPLLPSLESKAFGATGDVPKFFVHMRSPHGGVSHKNMWPADTALTEKMTYLHEIRRGALVAPVNASGEAVIS